MKLFEIIDKLKNKIGKIDNQNIYVLIDGYDAKVAVLEEKETNNKYIKETFKLITNDEKVVIYKSLSNPDINFYIVSKSFNPEVVLHINEYFNAYPRRFTMMYSYSTDELKRMEIKINR